MKTALIVGISGQDGAYLANLLLEIGYNVIGTSRDATTQRFTNLERLGIAEKVRKHSMVLTDFQSVFHTLRAIEPDEIYNLSGQSSVGLSFQQPLETFESNSIGVINIMEAIRLLKLNSRFYNAGSSECFGNTPPEGADETTPFNPRSPYATAKAAAFWAVANYREAYGLEACSGILFNHESPLRAERFVTQKIVSGAISIARNGGVGFLELGNLEISRDWGWAPEYVEAMWLMLQQEALEDLVIATGLNSTLREFCSAAFEAVGLKAENHIRSTRAFERPSDIQFSVGNPSHAIAKLNWSPSILMPLVAEAMVKDAWDKSRR